MSDKGTVYFARWILCGDELIENGAVRVVDGLIDRVGFKTGIRQSEDRIINLGERMLLPGMINLHTALEEVPLRGTFRPYTMTHTEFLAKRDTLLARYTHKEVLQGVRLALGESVANGITTTVTTNRKIQMAEYESFPGRTWLLGHFATKDAHSRYEMAHILADKLTQGTIKGITPDRLYTVSPQWLKEMLRMLQKHGGIFATHLAESADEMRAFSENQGPLFDALMEEEKWHFGKGERGSVWYALANNLIPRGSIIINPAYCGADQLSAINALRTTIAISPRYSRYFDLTPFPLELARNRHLSLAVTTETPAVSDTINLLDELFDIRRHNPHIPPLELIKMVTINPAKALKMGNKLGTIQQGKQADLIAVEVEQHCTNPLEEIISGNGNVGFVAIQGEEIIIP